MNSATRVGSFTANRTKIRNERGNERDGLEDVHGAPNGEIWSAHRSKDLALQHSILTESQAAIPPQTRRFACNSVLRAIRGRRLHRQEIIDHLETQKDAAALTTKLKAGALALAAGLPASLEGLLMEAIRRADAKASA